MRKVTDVYRNSVTVSSILPVLGSSVPTQQGVET